MDEMTPEKLAVDRVERGLREIAPLLEAADAEHSDERLRVCANAVRACIEILQGKL